MKVKIYLFFLLLFFLKTSIFSSETISLNNSFSSGFSAHNKNSMPLWLHARDEGRWDYTQNSQWVNTLNSSFFYSNKNFSANLSAEIDYLPLTNRFYFHNYSITSKLFFLQLQIGRHKFNPILKSGNLGAGSYLFGDNFRPLPRITAGIPAYTPLPWHLKIFSIKGEISQGKLDDEWFEWEHKHEYLHEKYAYLKLNLPIIQPYFGLNHSAIMGGYKANGEEIPVDFINTFFAKGSEKIGGGDALNASGAHMGLYDFGFHIKTNNKIFHIYYQIPFTDRSGMKIFSRNKDQIAGVDIELQNNSYLKNITVEWHHTAFQSGNGTPDMIDNKGKTYTTAEIREIGFDKFMERFGQTHDRPYTQEKIDKYLMDSFNNGNRFGGRDGYMSNYSYSTGWIYYGQIMGSPLNLARQQIDHNSPILGTYQKNLIVNDRYKAVHIGINGAISPFWEWTIKTTVSKNYGSYFQEYPGRYTWKRTENYFFENGLYQSYSYLNIAHLLKNNENLKFSSEIGYDYGEINKSFGMKFKVIYSF